MNEEKLVLKTQKSNKSAQGKGGKPKEKKTDQPMANELSDSQSGFESSTNPNVLSLKSDRALH